MNVVVRVWGDGIFQRYLSNSGLPRFTLSMSVQVYLLVAGLRSLFLRAITVSADHNGEHI